MNSNNSSNSTNWDATLLNYGGGYLTYGVRYSRKEKFVARFKHCPRDRAGFQSFLVKNFTPDEYFARLDAGETPAGILESKGYVSATVKRMRKLEAEAIERAAIWARIGAQTVVISMPA